MAGVEPVRAWCRVSMELPPPEVAAGLETDPGRHVWLVESVNRDARRHFPVLTNIWWTRPDVIRVTVEMGNG
jgi:DNA-binding GntR family transcriptional regulator